MTEREPLTELLERLELDDYEAEHGMPIGQVRLAHFADVASLRARLAQAEKALATICGLLAEPDDAPDDGPVEALKRLILKSVAAREQVSALRVVVERARKASRMLERHGHEFELLGYSVTSKEALDLASEIDGLVVPLWGLLAATAETTAEGE